MNLMEIMVVIAIIGIVGSVMAIGVMGAWDRAQADATCIQLKQLDGALMMYATRGKRVYPSTAEGLTVLGTLLPDGEVPLDPWGNAYRYVGPVGGAKYTLTSLGADGAEGGADTNRDLSLATCGR